MDYSKVLNTKSFASFPECIAPGREVNDCLFQQADEFTQLENIQQISGWPKKVILYSGGLADNKYRHYMLVLPGNTLLPVCPSGKAVFCVAAHHPDYLTNREKYSRSMTVDIFAIYYAESEYELLNLERNRTRLDINEGLVKMILGNLPECYQDLEEVPGYNKVDGFIRPPEYAMWRKQNGEKVSGR